MDMSDESTASYTTKFIADLKARTSFSPGASYTCKQTEPGRSTEDGEAIQAKVPRIVRCTSGVQVTRLQSLPEGSVTMAHKTSSKRRGLIIQ